MARPAREAIETFTRITGASESVAVRKLEEYGGNLDAAINAHFVEDDRQFTTVSPRYDYVDTRIQREDDSRGILPLLSAARTFKPSLLLDPNYRRNLVNQIRASVSSSHDRRYSHPGEFNSAEFNNGYEQPHHSGPRPIVEDPIGNSLSHGYQFHGNISRDHQAYLHHDDVEEQIIQHAIEASKQEDSYGIPQRQLHLEDDELARAISLSLKTAEQEKATREQMVVKDPEKLVVHDSSEIAEKTKDRRFQPGSSSSQGRAEDLEGQSLWGGISSKELDEAMLLEAALFGGIPEETSFQHASHPQIVSDQSLHPHQVPCRPSSLLLSQRLLREQQDNEYFASLLADREKEKSATNKLETSCFKDGEAQNKILDEEESERLLAAKVALLPQEPAIGDENAVTLLVRMPDGSRCSRRFLKSDKLQFLFDFIDIGRKVKPRTYMLVRPYPRCTFCADDSSLSFNELGLTNKQEALFLEMI